MIDLLWQLYDIELSYAMFRFYHIFSVYSVRWLSIILLEVL